MGGAGDYNLANFYVCRLMVLYWLQRRGYGFTKSVLLAFTPITLKLMNGYKEVDA